ncbi:hypothetical protein FHS43_001199 [Streptosporangium becharense]|uniref:Uncharacterized protein n=1 Tax=Streptosporangium becharense TaxID=1816182 RepID=A0A7W9IE75_9ACTN|nr:hypothetical protein [Streptosporangium becharense]MBB2909953.1 hypothetical protein [Streptosporangium becharense]MBB5819092.1 hypothetical protein [Streptosporangium becharense]
MDDLLIECAVNGGSAAVRVGVIALGHATRRRRVRRATLGAEGHMRLAYGCGLAWRNNFELFDLFILGISAAVLAHPVRFRSWFDR